MPLSNIALARIALGGGVVVLSSVSYFRKRISDKFHNQNFFHDTIKIIHGYKDATRVLGEPLTGAKVDLGKRLLNYSMEHEARVAVPVSGPKDKGTVHSWATRENITDNWQVDRCDMEVRNQRWTFYIHPDARERFKPHDPTGQVLDPEPGEITKILLGETKIDDSIDQKTNQLEYVKS